MFGGLDGASRQSRQSDRSGHHPQELAASREVERFRDRAREFPHEEIAEFRCVGKLVEAVRTALRQVIGTYGIALVHRDIPDFIIGARRGSPLVLGVGKEENFLASDVSAIVAYTRDAAGGKAPSGAAWRAGAGGPWLTPASRSAHPKG